MDGLDDLLSLYFFVLVPLPTADQILLVKFQQRGLPVRPHQHLLDVLLAQQYVVLELDRHEIALQ
jgi:hypothetical protein